MILNNYGQQKSEMKELLKKGLAEMFGTFVLVFVAVGTAVGSAIAFGEVSLVGTALAFGLVIVAMAYTIGKISGCHINPAVSLGALITKRMTVKEFFVYIVAQFIGAIIGAVLLFGIVRMAFGSELMLAEGFVWGTNGILGGGNVLTAGNVIGALLIEIVLTCVFVYVILTITAKRGDGNKACPAIAATLALVHLIGINFTGTSVNPARSFGPALMAMAFGGGTVALEQYWIFLVAPLIGAVLAALLFKLFHKKDAKEAELKAPAKEEIKEETAAE